MCMKMLCVYKAKVLWVSIRNSKHIALVETECHFHSIFHRLSWLQSNAFDCWGANSWKCGQWIEALAIERGFWGAWGAWQKCAKVGSRKSQGLYPNSLLDTRWSPPLSFSSPCIFGSSIAPLAATLLLAWHTLAIGSVPVRLFSCLPHVPRRLVVQMYMIIGTTYLDLNPILPKTIV